MSFYPHPLSVNFQLAKISVIIPTLNEADHIAIAIQSIIAGENTEIIIVDAGSQDQTVEISQQFSDQFPLKIIASSPGRGQQMNLGAQAASGEILLFLHADTQLPEGYDKMVRTALTTANTVAGAFALKIDAPQFSLRLIEWGVKVRSRYFQLPYGDQAIFLKRDLFFQIGMFPDMPIMEDFVLIRRLQGCGRITFIPVPVITSARRWLSTGIFKTTLINQVMIIGYFLGISPQLLRRIYRGLKSSRTIHKTDNNVIKNRRK